MTRTVMLLAALIVISGCSGKTGEGAARGASTGAVSGAVGGFFGALVFGGDVVEGAARGAVIGTAAGATAGAISGAEQDRRIAEQRQAQLDAVRRQVGPDTFAGLEALADCEHDVALAQAEKALRSDNESYVLAGLWLEVVTYTDSRREAEARALYPALIERDPKVASAEEIELEVRQFLQQLTSVRAEFNLPQICAV